jgi:hypothetical protein
VGEADAKSDVQGLRRRFPPKESKVAARTANISSSVEAPTIAHDDVLDISRHATELENDIHGEQYRSGEFWNNDDKNDRVSLIFIQCMEMLLSLLPF